MHSIALRTLADDSDQYTRERVEAILETGQEGIPFNLRHKAESLEELMKPNPDSLHISETAITCDDVRMILDQSPQEDVKQKAVKLQEHFQKNEVFQRRLRDGYAWSVVSTALSTAADRPEFLTVESVRQAIGRADSIAEMKKLLSHPMTQYLVIKGDLLKEIFDAGRSKFRADWDYSAAGEIFNAHTQENYEGALFEFDVMNYLRLLALGLDQAGDTADRGTGLSNRVLLLNDFAGKIEKKSKAQQFSKPQIDEINRFFFGIIVKGRGFSRPKLQQFYRTAFGRDLPQKKN